MSSPPDSSDAAASPDLGRPFASTPASASVTLEDLRARMAAFVHEREWHRFHQPRNVLLALVGEVGELAEIFQWRGEVPVGLGPSWAAADTTHLGEELSFYFNEEASSSLRAGRPACQSLLKPAVPPSLFYCPLIFLPSPSAPRSSRCGWSEARRRKPGPARSLRRPRSLAQTR